MFILSEPFTRDLVFFGVIAVLLACLGLYGLTTIIFNKKYHHIRDGISCICIACLLLLCDIKLALIMTAR